MVSKKVIYDGIIYDNIDRDENDWLIAVMGSRDDISNPRIGSYSYTTRTIYYNEDGYPVRVELRTHTITTCDGGGNGGGGGWYSSSGDWVNYYSGGDGGSTNTPPVESPLQKIEDIGVALQLEEETIECLKSHFDAVTLSVLTDMIEDSVLSNPCEPDQSTEDILKEVIATICSNVRPMTVTTVTDGGVTVLDGESGTTVNVDLDIVDVDRLLENIVTTEPCTEGPIQFSCESFNFVSNPGNTSKSTAQLTRLMYVMTRSPFRCPYSIRVDLPNVAIVNGIPMTIPYGVMANAAATTYNDAKDAVQGPNSYTNCSQPISEIIHGMKLHLELSYTFAIARWAGLTGGLADISYFGTHNFDVYSTLVPYIPVSTPVYDLVIFGFAEDDCTE